MFHGWKLENHNNQRNGIAPVYDGHMNRRRYYYHGRNAWDEAIRLNLQKKENHINQLTDDIRIQRHLILLRKKEQLRYKQQLVINYGTDLRLSF